VRLIGEEKLPLFILQLRRKRRSRATPTAVPDSNATRYSSPRGRHHCRLEATKADAVLIPIRISRVRRFAQTKWRRDRALEERRRKRLEQHRFKEQRHQEEKSREEERHQREREEQVGLDEELSRP
jgi:hypothetical protein